MGENEDDFLTEECQVELSPSELTEGEEEEEEEEEDNTDPKDVGVYDSDFFNFEDFK